MTARCDYIDCTYMLSPCLKTIRCGRCERDSLCSMYTDVMNLDKMSELTTCYAEGETVYDA